MASEDVMRLEFLFWVTVFVIQAVVILLKPFSRVQDRNFKLATVAHSAVYDRHANR
jgi:hypothetical protein